VISVCVFLHESTPMCDGSLVLHCAAAVISVVFVTVLLQRPHFLTLL